MLLPSADFDNLTDKILIGHGQRLRSCLHGQQPSQSRSRDDNNIARGLLQDSLYCFPRRNCKRGRIKRVLYYTMETRKSGIRFFAIGECKVLGYANALPQTRGPLVVMPMICHYLVKSASRHSSLTAFLYRERF